MKIIIQCASSKQEDAKCLVTQDRRAVIFVADVACAPQDGQLYAHPDGPSDEPKMTWRQQVELFNNNQSGSLTEAFRLYKHRAYEGLASRFGLDNLFILSAGWGLVKATYRLPKYDITFAGHKNVPSYKRRLHTAMFHDFNQLGSMGDGPIIFLGGKSYLAAFERLTRSCNYERIVFYQSQEVPKDLTCRAVKFETTTRTNWHYECAAALIEGRVKF